MKGVVVAYKNSNIQTKSHQKWRNRLKYVSKLLILSISCFCDFDLYQVSYNIISSFWNIILIKNIYPHLKFKYIPSADFYEIRNTTTDKFAFCGGTLIDAMETVQEPYFTKHVFSYNNLSNLVLFLVFAGICVADRTHYENVL